VQLKRSYVFGGCFQRTSAEELGELADVIRVSVDRPLRKIAELHVVGHTASQIGRRGFAMVSSVEFPEWAAEKFSNSHSVSRMPSIMRQETSSV
jgi:hypothetical protein